MNFEINKIFMKKDIIRCDNIFLPCILSQCILLVLLRCHAGMLLEVTVEEGDIAEMILPGYFLD